MAAVSVPSSGSLVVQRFSPESSGAQGTGSGRSQPSQNCAVLAEVPDAVMKCPSRRLQRRNAMADEGVDPELLRMLHQDDWL